MAPLFPTGPPRLPSAPNRRLGERSLGGRPEAARGSVDRLTRCCTNLPPSDWRPVALELGDLGGPFVFESTSVDGGLVSLRYGIGPDLVLTETVQFPFDLPDTPTVDRLVHVLHLVAGVSYYKTVAPTTLVAPALTAAERALVARLYDDGLREFAYRNDIAVPLPVQIEADEVEAQGHVPPTGHGALVPIGGGKDSALVAELVPDGELFAVNPVGAQVHLAEALGRPLVGARRTLDPVLRELNALGAPNGHVPVTAITSAISVLAAVALGRHDVLMGIERSADEPTVVTADGVPVNHQFSKSYEAELLLRAVFEPAGVRYLSLLRPLTELAIGAGVAGRGLAADIVSCNRVFTVWNESSSSREQRPCGECAKCLFTSLMLAPSLTTTEVEQQYGRALLDDPDHVQGVRDLWSVEKPFDCVGERLETAAAVDLLAHTDGWRDQVVVQALADEAAALLADADASPDDFLQLGPLELLPEEYRPTVASLAAELAAVPGRHRAAR